MRKSTLFYDYLRNYDRDHIEFSFNHYGRRGNYHISFEMLPLSKKDFNTLFRDKITHEAAGELAAFISGYCSIIEKELKMFSDPVPDLERELKRFVTMSELINGYYNDIPVYGTAQNNNKTNEKTTKKEVTTMKTTNFFQGVKTLEELRNNYRDLLKKHHPDNGGSEEITKEINEQYKKAFDLLKSGADLSDEKTAIKWNDAEDQAIREALNKIIHLENINIEIVGSWIWVDGETYTGRDILKAAGYKWSRNRQKWHFAPYEKKYYKGNKKSFDEIRAKYGSETVETENRKALTA